MLFIHRVVSGLGLVLLVSLHMVTSMVGRTTIPYHTTAFYHRLCPTHFRLIPTPFAEENKSGVVEMMGVEPECAIICVDHMYGKEVSILPEKYEPLMYVATLMQLHTLRDAITALLEADLDPKSFFVARKIASIYGCDNLMEKCNDFAEMNFGLLSKEKDFGELEKSCIEKVLKSRSKQNLEANKLDGLLIWIRYKSERSDLFAEMFMHINLSEIPVANLRYLLEHEPAIRESMEFMRKVSTSMFDKLKVDSEQIGVVKKSPSGIIVFDETSGHLQCFNPRDHSWKQMQEMNPEMKMHRFSAVCIHDSLYVLLDNGAVYRIKYCNESASWERLPDTIEKHGIRPPVVVCSGIIYVVGSREKFNSNSVEMYIPALNEWRRLQDMPHPSMKCAVLGTQNYIYCFGGIERDTYLNDVRRFDPKSSTWIELAPMHKAKHSLIAVELNNKFFVMGGNALVGGYSCLNEDLNSLECYNIDLNEWTTLSGMCVARTLAAAVVIDEFIYVLGGENSSKTIEMYDVEKDQWVMTEIPDGMELTIKQSAKIIIPF